LHALIFIKIMRPNLQHDAIYHSLFYDFVPTVRSVSIRLNYMYMSYFLHIRNTSLLICVSINQMAKIRLLDRWSWNRQLSWNISNCWSVLHYITVQQITHLHNGTKLISCMLFLVSFFGQDFGPLWRMSMVTSFPLQQFPFKA
jgi:hypothetical protein